MMSVFPFSDMLYTLAIAIQLYLSSTQYKGTGEKMPKTIIHNMKQYKSETEEHNNSIY